MSNHQRSKGRSAKVGACNLLLALLLLFSTIACAERPAVEQRLIVATTHTLEDSGLLDSITAGFNVAHPEQKIEVVVAGSGEVLAIATRGDADAVLTHSPDDEGAFVSAGHGVARRPVAHNEFLVAGPAADPANIATAASAADAFAKIKAAQQPFVSRADDSGTHKKEKAVWKAARITPDPAHYIESGVGMADALRIADQRNAYILTDVATFVTLEETLGLNELYGGDPILRNSYSVIVVTNARNTKGANAFADWITGPDAQMMIGDFGRAKYGRALFTADVVTTNGK